MKMLCTGELVGQVTTQLTAAAGLEADTADHGLPSPLLLPDFPHCQLV